MTRRLIILGLGAMGSATACYAARAGLQVTGIDLHRPPHVHGSHHGESRMIRQAYFEHPAYVPFLLRAYTLWDALQADTGRELLLRTGGLMAGRHDSALIEGVLRSAAQWGLPHERLSTAQVRQRYPHFHLDRDMEAVFETAAGLLRPEACVDTFLDVARHHGARLLAPCTVHRWHATPAGVQVHTDQGLLEADQLVLSAGAGLPGLLARSEGLPAGAPARIAAHVRVTRQVVAHYTAGPAGLPLDRQHLPVFAIEEPDGRFYYGFPDLGHGLKVARHGGGEDVGHAEVDTTLRSADLRELDAFLQRRMPGCTDAVREGIVCRYTNTPDQHFVIDRLAPNVVLCSPCSGHGMKFASAVGEEVARMAMQLPPRNDLGFFSLRRFAGAEAVTAAT